MCVDMIYIHMSCVHNNKLIPIFNGCGILIKYREEENRMREEYTHPSFCGEVLQE